MSNKRYKYATLLLKEKYEIAQLLKYKQEFAQLLFQPSAKPCLRVTS